MRRALLTIGLVFLTGSLPLFEAVAQDASASFAAGSRAFTDGDYEQALRHFEEARDAGSRGPAVHYNIGVSNYRLGNYTEAGIAFQALLDDYPTMRDLAQYNLALTRLKQGREREARNLFEKTQLEAGDEKLARLAAAMLDRMDSSSAHSAEATPSWFSSVDINAGHDENVALIDDSSLPAGVSVDSAFTELVAVLSGPVANAPGFRFDGSAYAVRYRDAGEYDQTSVRVGGVYSWNSGDWRIEAGPHFSYSTLNGDGFEQHLGAGLRLRRGIGSSLRLGLSFVHDEVSDADARFAYVEGARDRIGLTLDRYGNAGRLTLAYRIEINDRADPAVSPDRNRLSLRYRYAMSRNWAADFLVAYRTSRYDEMLVPRDEDRTEAAFGLVRELQGGWQVSGSYLWYDNDSNVDFYSYARSRLVLGVTRTF